MDHVDTFEHPLVKAFVIQRAVTYIYRWLLSWTSFLDFVRDVMMIERLH